MKMWGKLFLGLATTTVLYSCGGGGGGSTSGGGGGGYTPAPLDPVLYPYETVFGEACAVTEPTPGCTFLRSTGQRATVSLDTDYDSQGYGSDDLWYVKFDSYGNAQVFDDLGYFQYNASINQFAGFVGGTTIGVGNSGAFWENVSGKTYWFGNEGVLYSSDLYAPNYGQAINNKQANKATDVNSKAILSETNKKLIKAGADKLVKKYGLTQTKAVAVASALNSWAIVGAERGKVASSDMDKTFKTVFGVKFSEALSAVNAFRNGDLDAADKARDLTNRSANALGLKPDQAKEFIKGMYKGAIEEAGMSVDDVNW